MEKEFTIATGWKVFYGVFALLIGAGAIFILIAGFKSENSLPAAIAGGLIIAGLAALIGGQLRKKVIVSAGRIINTNVLQTKEIPVASVKGCRIGPKVIVIEPHSPNHPKITINNYSDFNNSEALVDWLKKNFKDLNAADLGEARERLLQDTHLGATKEEREAKIKNAKWIAIIYSAIGFALVFATIPFDQNKAVALFLVIYPLLGIVIMACSGGLIKVLSDTKKSVYSFIFLGLAGPVMGLCFSDAFDYNILQYGNFYLPVLAVCLVTAGLLYTTGKNEQLSSITGQILIILLVSAGYGYGSVEKMNCLFDKTPPQIVHATIESKFKEYSKGEHYYLRLNPLTSGSGKQQVEVGAITYDKYTAGDRIDIDVKKGLLNIPWYFLP